ncbi:MAG: BamA/TamA family outer membrane protein [Bacteroidales bacterium]|nr:BamA/TamA family outer membrane protein [Bacteroidales bacterium]MBN2755965.1 BamA/TamA family outer membrane protein [Bacteroidales bacterium]
MMKKIIILIVAVLFSALYVYSQEDTTATDLKKKSGFSFGALPVVAYTSDIGFQYGALANFYHYGDGSRYPAYDHSLYVEWSRSTKGYGSNILRYDSERLIPNMRVTAEASYLTEKALDFYGFNGYNAVYVPEYEDQTLDTSISRLFYRYERKVIKLKADFQGNIIGRKLRWLAGVTYLGTEIATVDIDNINGDKDETDEDFISTDESLYNLYKEWDVIKESEEDGGNNTSFKMGIVYDTRDNEPNPNNGMWTEALLFYGPSFLGYENNVTSMLLLHRQYFTLIKNKMTFAYRLAYQTKLGGDIPFYLLPYYIDSKNIQDGFGGSKTMRGILRNRVVGDGVALANFEFRWKVINTVLFNQNFYIALSAFTDMARVVDPYQVDLSGVDATVNIEGINYNPREWFTNGEEAWHISYGAGIHFAINDNFIVAVDYGLAAKPEDGTSGIYIGLNFLY